MGIVEFFKWLEEEGLNSSALPIDINYGYKTGRGIQAVRDIRRNETICHCKYSRITQ